MVSIGNLINALGESLVINIISECANHISNDIKYKEYFTKASKYINLEGYQVENFNEIFSKENMTAISNGMRLKGNVSMKTYLVDELSRLMKSYDVPAEIADVCIDQYICSFCNIIKEENYDLCIEWKLDEVKQNLEVEIKRTANLIESTYQSYLSLYQQSIYVYSISAMNQQLRNNTEYPQIDLDFFIIDDNNFKDKFKNALKNNKDVINIKARCTEEATYGILNELRSLHEKRPVFVVKDKDDWHRLINYPGEGCIYIPWFYEEECEPIPNNITIFVYNDNEPIFSMDYLSLRPRTFATINKQLAKAGLDYTEANAMISQSHGLYMLMKKKIFKSRQMRKPKWLNSLPKKVKVVSLLLGSWTEAEGDIAVVEKLSGLSYDEFISLLTPQFNDEDPLVCKRKRNGAKAYYISDCSVAWEYLKNNIDEKTWENFINELTNVMSKSDDYFSLSTIEKFNADVQGKSPFLSSAIRHGMINTLKIGAFLYDRCYRRKLDEIAEKIISSISDEKQWIYICDYLADLFEISPTVMLSRFKNEFENSTGLLEICSKESEALPFSRSYHNEILCSFEQLFVQREYADEALELLIKFVNKRHNYQISPCPQGRIDRILIPSHNLSIYDSVNLKRTAARKVIKECVHGWNIIYEVLYASSYLIIGFPKSEYRKCDEIDEDVLWKEYFDLKQCYFNLLVDNIDQHADRLIKLIDKINEVSNKNKDIFYCSFKQNIAGLDDEQKIVIQKHIINKVNDHRKYAHTDWAMNEYEVEKLEQLLSYIKMNSEENQYVYLFDQDMGKILQNPVHYEDDNDYDLDCKELDKLIESRLSQFVNKGLDLQKLIRGCVKSKNTTLGIYAARYIDGYHINKLHLQWLYDSEISRKMAYDYCNEISQRHPEEILDIIHKNEYFDDDFLVKLYYIQFRCMRNEIPEIDRAQENIKKLFWKQNKEFRNNNTEWLLHECFQYGSLNSYITTLYDANGHDNALGSKLYDYIILILKIKQDNSVYSYTCFCLKSLLQSIFKMGIINDDQSISNMISIELIFYITYGLLNWEDMIFCQEEIRRRPDLYAQIISICIKKKDGSYKDSDVHEEVRRKFFHLLQWDIKFCPAERDHKVNYNELNLWIDGFYQLLEDNQQENLFSTFLGKAFAYAPDGKDGHMPCESIRKAIEQYGDKKLIDEVVCTIENSRGFVNVTAGENEASLSKRYEKEYEYFKSKYPKTARIFKELSEDYSYESLKQRESAENGEF